MNSLHGWTCPTCGTERGECDVAVGTAPVLADGVRSMNEMMGLAGAWCPDCRYSVETNTAGTQVLRKVAGCPRHLGTAA